MRDTIYADTASAGAPGSDALGHDALDNVAGFRFDEQVAAVFPDMIQRSVPGYSNIIAMTGLLAARHAQDHSNIYDLGCSLGASTLAMAAQLQQRPLRFVVVDNAEAMLVRCREAVVAAAPQADISLVCAALQDVPIANASVVVLNFTLQFVPLAERDAVLQNICNGLRPGGVLVLSEKIRFDNDTLQQLTTELHHAFKMANGYSALEVSRKRAALDNVLMPETLAAHEQRLQAAGFAHVGVWFQCFNFVSLVAIK